ncbi:hypothetical protein AAGN54_13915, partial [Klebsiella pneumoniae]
MDAIFDRVVREFFPNTTIPFWKKWLFRTAFGNKVFSGNDSNLLIVFYVQIMPDDFVMQLHR